MSLAKQDSSDDHGEHHLPAVDDWPRGFGEASWWPFIAALGVAGIYVGAALFILGNGANDIVSPIAGPVVLVGATALFLGGLYGWLYHAFIVSFWEHGTSGHGSGTLKLAMLLFLGTEIATFGAGFVYYFFIRSGPWLVERPEALISPLIIVNTLVLISSSVTLHFAHVSLRKDNRTWFVRLLGATLLLGILFLAGQAMEYYEFLVHEGFSLQSGVFGSAFYGLTGLHGLHVSLGAVLLAILFFRGLYGHYSSRKHTSVSTISMYWHFVDIVWVFLVVVIYVGGQVTL